MSALGVLVGVPMLTGYAQWWEVLAVIVGLVLIALELFVVPGFGLPGITGLALFVFGLTMTFVGSEPGGPSWFPKSSGAWDALKQGLFIVTGGMLSSLFLWFWLSRYLPKLPYFNKLILTGDAGGAGTGAGAIAGIEVDAGAPHVGDAAMAITDLRPGGSARLEASGSVTPVVSDSGFVKAGERLIVREVAGNRVVVRPVV